MNKKINFKIFSFLLFLLIGEITLIYADNWVCYDSTGKVTESQLREQFSNIGVQPNSPLQIIDTTSKSTTFSKSSYFRSCENSNTFNYCPENKYYLKSVFSSAQRCNSFSGAHHQYTGSNNLIAGVDCGLGGGPSCNSFYSVGGGIATQSFVCGKNNNAWETMTASNDWICPSCKELSLRYGDTPPNMGNISSFRDLSFPNGNKISNSTIDLSFMVYILACINRVPMLNLQVDLIDSITGGIKNTEYGIYAKHETLDYNEENLGMLREYHLPNQEEFKKTYYLNGTLKGYRAWAWRQRLVDGINRVINKKNLNVPGFPYNNKQKFGNLYYSDDFLFNLNKIDKVAMNTFQEVQKSQTGVSNVLKNIDYLNGNEMCTISDLENYVSKYGLTNVLLNNLKQTIPIDTQKNNYNNIEILKGEDEIINLDYHDLKFNTTYYKTAKEIKKELDDGYNGNLNLLYNLNVLDENKIILDAKNKVSSWFDYSPNKGCSDYDYKINNINLVGQDYDYTVVTKEIKNEETNETKEIKTYIFTFNDLKINAIWDNDIIAKIKLDYNTTISTEYSWNFATLGDLEPLNLAKCLYNWDECILSEVNDNDKTFFEVADCGLGPPSDLAEPSMKDGARGQKTIIQPITVYRKCDIGDEWVSKNNVYTCVNSTIYKCNFALDASEVLLKLKLANIGDTLRSKTNNGISGYICRTPGIWEKISCNP